MNNGIIDGNGMANNGAPKAPKEKTGMKTFLEGLRRKYDAIRYSKAGKWVMRGLTVLTLGGTAKAAYDKGVAKGKASVVPTLIVEQPIQPETETTEEAPAEEEKTEVEETV